MLRSCEYLNQQSTAYATKCERRLFVHRDTTYIYLLGLHPSFRARIMCFLFFLSLFSFSMWSLLLLVQVKHKRTLYRFLL